MFKEFQSSNTTIQTDLLLRILFIILLQVSRRTVSWFHLINSQDTQDDMTEKMTNPVENKIDNPVIMTYPVDNPVVKKY